MNIIMSTSTSCLSLSLISGWGVMSLEDIPKGSFVCCYTGLIVSDDEADNRGLCLGDDYLAEMDYIGMETHTLSFSFCLIVCLHSSIFSFTFIRSVRVG